MRRADTPRTTRCFEIENESGMCSWAGPWIRIGPTLKKCSVYEGSTTSKGTHVASVGMNPDGEAVAEAAFPVSPQSTKVLAAVLLDADLEARRDARAAGVPA